MVSIPPFTFSGIDLQELKLTYVNDNPGDFFFDFFFMCARFFSVTYSSINVQKSEISLLRAKAASAAERDRSRHKRESTTLQDNHIMSSEECTHLDQINR